MKKIIFNFKELLLNIESDDTDSEEFIQKYAALFFDKIEEYNLKLTQIDPKEFETEKYPSLLDNQFDKAMSIFGITEQQLKYLIDFNNNKINLILKAKHLRGNKAEMQVNLALLYCGACEYNGAQANTKEIRDICNRYDCYDTNFAANIKRDNYFSIEGSTNATIYLTMPGKDKLVEIAKQFYELTVSS